MIHMSYLLNCENSNIAIKLFNELKTKRIVAKIVPTPSSISSGCGLSLVINNDEDFNSIDKRSYKFVAYQIDKNDEKHSNYTKL